MLLAISTPQTTASHRLTPGAGGKNSGCKNTRNLTNGLSSAMFGPLEADFSGVVPTGSGLYKIAQRFYPCNPGGGAVSNCGK